MENLSIGAEHSRIFLAIYRFQIRFRFQFVFVFAFDWDSALNLALFAECLWQTEFVVAAAVVTLLLLLLFYCLLLLLLLLYWYFLINFNTFAPAAKLIRAAQRSTAKCANNLLGYAADCDCDDDGDVGAGVATVAQRLRLDSSGDIPHSALSCICRLPPVVCCMHAVVSFFLWLPVANFASMKTQRQAEAGSVNQRVCLSVCECVKMC